MPSGEAGIGRKLIIHPFHKYRQWRIWGYVEKSFRESGPGFNHHLSRPDKGTNIGLPGTTRYPLSWRAERPFGQYA